MMLTPMQKHSSILMIPKRRETVEFDQVSKYTNRKMPSYFNPMGHADRKTNVLK